MKKLHILEVLGIQIGSFQNQPPSATMLYSEIIPPVGGDTLFANTADAYDDLSDDIKRENSKF